MLKLPSVFFAGGGNLSIWGPKYFSRALNLIITNAFFGWPNIKAEATIAEFSAVGRLRSDDAMSEGFLAIASRKGISPSAQSHLVVPALSSLYHESAKVEVMLELIKNPDFSHQAKKKILSNLHRLEFEASRIKVLNAINHRQIGVQNPIPTSEGKLRSVLYE